MTKSFKFKDLVFYFALLLDIAAAYPAFAFLFLMSQFNATTNLYSFPTIAVKSGLILFGSICLLLALLTVLAIYQKKHKKKSAYYLIWVPFILGVITTYVLYKFFGSMGGNPS
jgi:hypothetical protein